MAQRKATKKFEKNHLKDTIKRRKEFAKVKQRNLAKDKKRARKAEDEAPADDHPDNKAQVKKGKQDGANFEEMNVDDFFQGGFDIPEELKESKKKGSKAADASTRKRKRQSGEADEEALGSSDDDDVEQNPVLGGDDSASDSEDDPETYKQQLAALAEKDPEFHKYLQENDSELLNFEDADLGEIDALSGSEAEEEGPKKKKQRKDERSKQDEDSEDEGPSTGNEVTKATIKKWEKAMTEQHSLRATREVALAFRAAAHVSDEEDKEFKYSISDPEAYHELLVITLKHLPKVLEHHLPIKENKESGKV